MHVAESSVHLRAPVRVDAVHDHVELLHAVEERPALHLFARAALQELLRGFVKIRTGELRLDVRHLDVRRRVRGRGRSHLHELVQARSGVERREGRARASRLRGRHPGRARCRCRRSAGSTLGARKKLAPPGASERRASSGTRGRSRAMRVGNSRSRPDRCHPEARARAFQGSGVRRRETARGAPLGAARKLTLARHLFSSSRGDPEKPPKERTSDARDRAFVRIAIRRATCASMRVEIAAFVASSARVGVRRRRQSRSRKSERARAPSSTRVLHATGAHGSRRHFPNCDCFPIRPRRFKAAAPTETRETTSREPPGRPVRKSARDLTALAIAQPSLSDR